MANTRITVNGKHYDSPEAMPPDVRRMYEEAMRTLGPSLAGGQAGASTQVFTGQAGDGASLIVNRVVTVNNKTYGSVDDLPPEVRQQYEEALKGASVKGIHPKTSMHVSLNASKPQVGTHDDSIRSRTPPPLPMEPSSLEARIRDIPMSLAILVLIGLILWAFLDR